MLLVAGEWMSFYMILAVNYTNSDNCFLEWDWISLCSCGSAFLIILLLQVSQGRFFKIPWFLCTGSVHSELVRQSRFHPPVIWEHRGLNGWDSGSEDQPPLEMFTHIKEKYYRSSGVLILAVVWSFSTPAVLGQLTTRFRWCLWQEQSNERQACLQMLEI